MVTVGNSEEFCGGGTLFLKAFFTFFTAWLLLQLLYKERYGKAWLGRKQLQDNSRE